VRLVLGDTHTGDTSFDEDVVGRIGRSCGALKVPLLLENAQVFGSPITCDRILAVLDCVLDWKTGLPLYRHASYRPPELKLDFDDDEGCPWCVRHGTGRSPGSPT
jgi:hypothetical protein